MTDTRPILNTDQEIVYIIPDRLLPRFSELLFTLEEQLEELRLESFTIETASMEEVSTSK